MTNCCICVKGNSYFINFVHTSREYSAILAATRHGGETLCVMRKNTNQTNVMNIDLTLHKTIESLNKMKTSYLTLFLAFISSFNFWFLSIYFFKHSFIEHHGIVIALMTTFVFTITWNLISFVTIPKDFLLVCYVMKEYETMNDVNNQTIKVFIFSEIIVLHAIFAYLTYICHWHFLTFITVAFLTNGIKYFLTDILLKKEHIKYQEKINPENR